MSDVRPAAGSKAGTPGAAVPLHVLARQRSPAACDSCAGLQEESTCVGHYRSHSGALQVWMLCFDIVVLLLLLLSLVKTTVSFQCRCWSYGGVHRDRCHAGQGKEGGHSRHLQLRQGHPVWAHVHDTDCGTWRRIFVLWNTCGQQQEWGISRVQIPGKVAPLYGCRADRLRWCGL